jgi:hypothetical protein
MDEYEKLKEIVKKLIISLDKDEDNAVTGFFSSESYDLIAELRVIVDG